MASRGDQNVAERLAQVQLERQELQLELEREQVEVLRAKREQRTLTRAQQRRDLENAERDRRYREDICSHKKGGMGVDGINEGDDTKYAVIKHVYPNGSREVMCQRCQKIWEEPSPELKKTDRHEYTRLLRSWQEALRFPTDNKESGKQLFTITRTAA